MCWRRWVGLRRQSEAVRWSDEAELDRGDGGVGEGKTQLYCCRDGGGGCV